VSTESHRCYLLSCDHCATGYAEDTAGYVLHFDTPDDAIEHAEGAGWRLTGTGDIHCPRCVTHFECTHNGHALSDWMVCACRGVIPDHARFGCGLFRFCQREHCDHYVTATLAALPETHEPIPGR
jgi:hypothetical protein